MRKRVVRWEVRARFERVAHRGNALHRKDASQEDVYTRTQHRRWAKET